MELFQQFQHNFKQHLLVKLPANHHIIVAVSGGLDSVALCHLLHKSGVNFSIAHCNFQLRGAESDRDESFVKQLAQKYNKQIAVKHFTTQQYADENKISIQLAARQLRYHWFKEMQQAINSDKINTSNIEHRTSYIALAHHQNDNIETVLFNLFRGTGVAGLTGMDAFDRERKLIRPLLPFTKDALLQYAQQQGLQFVEDSSNSSDKYSRNYIRNQVFPLVTQHFANAESNISASISRLAEVAAIYNNAIVEIKDKLLQKVGEEYKISVLKLQKQQQLQTIVWETIKDFGFAATQVTEVIKLLNANTGSYINSGTHRILKNRDWLLINPLLQKDWHHIIIEKNTGQVNFESGILQVKTPALSAKELSPSPDKNIAFLNASKIEYPLILRKWKQGDYFYPLGMNKKQKLSKFFINQKLSVADKEKVWVLESASRVVWVIGYRIDDRFKLNQNTKEVLQLEVSEK